MEFGIALRRGVLVMACLIGIGATAACSKSYSWRYKMIVTVDTPEGEVSGFAVREMGNGTQASFLSQGGNPADVRGEAVVVDLGRRGVLFALISSDSDLEFYSAFRSLWPHGGSTPDGIKFYASLPVGIKGVLDPVHPPEYPKLVTFTDLSDPRSVTLAQTWMRKNDGAYYLQQDRMQENFGLNVHLKEITIEITTDPITKGLIERYLPWFQALKTERRQLNGNNTVEVSTSELSDNLGTRSFYYFEE